MKVIIAGSRSITGIPLVAYAVEHSGFPITEVVSGTARGADKLGEVWAEMNHIPVRKFPAKWGEFGTRAGYMRNQEMAAYAEALIAIWDGSSNGTRHMIDIAKGKGLPTFVLNMREAFGNQLLESLRKEGD